MRRLSVIAAASFSFANVVVLSACTNSPQGGQTLPAGAIVRETGGGPLRYSSLDRLSVTEHVVHSFDPGNGDAVSPNTGLLNVNGTFFGTTFSGGTYSIGTVFEISRSGKETVLHSFDKKPGGAHPAATLTDVNGILYGTTNNRGSGGDGTVFSITQSGKLTTLHSFAGYPQDGSDAYGALTNVNGTLYGTTLEGGTYNYGTIYSVTTTGHETVFHSFGAGSDGVYPFGGLLNINGKLYGTTSSGGAYGDGTVFSVTTSGKERVLHSFSGPPDGADPEAGLTNVNGTIYGTTYDGGSGCGSAGCGTVFSIDASGNNEKVLYRFAGSPDGDSPAAKLLNFNGKLYGTTTSGGGHSDGSVFTVTTSGHEAVLYSFKGKPDGKDPGYSGLIDFKGTLFGTTYFGGAYGVGTVYSISP